MAVFRGVLMSIRRFFCLLLMLTVGYGVSADISDIYSGWLDTFGSMADDNAGLSTFPTLLIPMGGRYEGMGTAYTAVVGDLGFIEANPAGSAEIQNPSIGIYHHQWYADTSLEGIAFATTVGPLGIGTGLKFFYSSFTEYDESGKRAGSGYLFEGVAILNLAVQIISLESFGLSVGISGKGVYRYVPESLALGQSAGALPIDVGAIAGFRLFDLSQLSRRNLTVGLSLKNFGQRVFALGAPLPTVFSTGLAYSPISFLLISADFNLPVSVEPDAFPAEAMYFSVGTDVTIADFLSIQAGARFKADNPRFSIGAVVGFGQVSLTTNYVIDVVSGFNPLDTLNIAATIDIGS